MKTKIKKSQLRNLIRETISELNETSGRMLLQEKRKWWQRALNRVGDVIGYLADLWDYMTSESVNESRRSWSKVLKHINEQVIANDQMATLSAAPGVPGPSNSGGGPGIGVADVSQAAPAGMDLNVPQIPGPNATNAQIADLMMWVSSAEVMNFLQSLPGEAQVDPIITMLQQVTPALQSRAQQLKSSRPNGTARNTIAQTPGIARAGVREQRGPNVKKMPKPEKGISKLLHDLSDWLQNIGSGND